MNEDLIYRIDFWLLLAIIFTIRIISMIRVRQAGEQVTPADEQVVEREGKLVFIIRVVVFISLVAFLVLYSINPSLRGVLSFYLPAWLRWAGFLLGLASLLLWGLAQKALDKQWSPQLQLRKEHELIKSGPYRIIRNPIYTAMFGWVVSLAMLTANWVFVLIGLLTVVFLIRRTPIEERMMAERFGEDYRKYMKKTGMFFPKLH